MFFRISKGVLQTALTFFAVTVIVFAVTEVDIEKIAVLVLGPFSEEDQRLLWLEANGYYRPAYVRYLEWLGRVLQGDLGHSYVFNVPVSEILLERLGRTGILALTTWVLMVPLAIILGTLAGARQGTLLDRGFSIFSTLTTSVPEFASAVLYAVIFVFWLKLLPGVSSSSEVEITQLVLPVLTLLTYGLGYLVRIIRSSMVEVMNAPYIRTARLKGASERDVLVKHAFRNAMMAPFTVILLQFPWLLSGVIVVETFFAYKGFGSLLLASALNFDVYLLEACTLVMVLVVIVTQILGDIGYWLLNPRLREV